MHNSRLFVSYLHNLIFSFSYVLIPNIAQFFCNYFSRTFGENNVGLLTGDSAVNKDARILIMTTEILRNMLYQRYVVETLLCVLWGMM